MIKICEYCQTEYKTNPHHNQEKAAQQKHYKYHLVGINDMVSYFNILFSLSHALSTHTLPPCLDRKIFRPDTARRVVAHARQWPDRL